MAHLKGQRGIHNQRRTTRVPACGSLKMELRIVTSSAAQEKTAGLDAWNEIFPSIGRWDCHSWLSGGPFSGSHHGVNSGTKNGPEGDRAAR